MSVHGHHQHAHGGDAGTRRLIAAVSINLALTAAQVFGGLLSGSLSLIADALHNFSDALGLLLALVARRISRRPADMKRTFGYGRAEVVGGLINLTSIIVLALYLLAEAAGRALEHREVDGWLVIVIAFVALVVDSGTAVLTYAFSKESVNLRAAFLHNLADALASVAVIISGVLILWLDWMWTDLVATAAISAYIVWMSLPPLRRCISILMQSTPVDLDLESVATTIRNVEGVVGVSHVHCWPIDERVRSLECRVTVRDAMLSALIPVRARIEEAVSTSHAIDHCTVQFVREGDAEGPLIGGDH